VRSGLVFLRPGSWSTAVSHGLVQTTADRFRQARTHLHQARPNPLVRGWDLPEEIVAQFRLLRDRVPPESFDDVRRIVEAELAGPIEGTFAEFDRAPIAAASIAQVHGARLLTASVWSSRSNDLRSPSLFEGTSPP